MFKDQKYFLTIKCFSGLQTRLSEHGNIILNIRYTLRSIHFLESIKLNIAKMQFLSRKKF